VDADSTTDLSGRWNDTDSRLVADEVITDVLNARWMEKWEKSNKVPTIIVGKIVNKSHEHISVETFVKDIERALLNSGKVEFVASKVERSQIREEREDQQENTSVTTRSDMGEEQGADLMLIGSINTIIDGAGKTSVTFYQVDMELIELESNKKVWMGGKKHKKVIERAAARL
jgi:PBP1b-binding outer membrane lipoprotein LpoB